MRRPTPMCRTDPAYQQILTALTEAGRPMRARDLCEALDLSILPKNTGRTPKDWKPPPGACQRTTSGKSNIHPSGFDTITPKTLAGASADGLIHRAHLVTTTGDSHRLAEALAGKGVVPLN
jgi:hypothetical protein